MPPIIDAVSDEPARHLLPTSLSLELAGAALVVAGCTLLCELLNAHLDLVDQIMVYLAGVVVVALRASWPVSVAAVLSSVLIFDLVFVPPRWSLNPLNPQHVITLLVMLGVGLLISRLASRAHEQTLLAEDRARRANALAVLSLRLSDMRDADGIESALRLALASHLPASVTVQRAGASFVLDEAGRAQAADLPADDQALLQALLRQASLALERDEFERRSAHARIEAEGERLRNTLLAGISHDFRTPLTTIVGAATSLRDQQQRLDATQRDALTDAVLHEATRLHRLVSDLLELTRLEDGAVALQPEWCPADDLVEEALAPLRTRAAQHPLGLQVQVEPGAIVWCDPRLLAQALANLVDNALCHTPPGTTVTVTLGSAADHWWLRVRDNGPGLAPGSEAEVFKKFHHGRPESSRTGGTGLGLAICQAVARLHGGRISAHNEGGAVFGMVLPQPERPGDWP